MCKAHENSSLVLCLDGSKSTLNINTWKDLPTRLGQPRAALLNGVSSALRVVLSSIYPGLLCNGKYNRLLVCVLPTSHLFPLRSLREMKYQITSPPGGCSTTRSIFYSSLLLLTCTILSYLGWRFEAGMSFCWVQLDLCFFSEFHRHKWQHYLLLAHLSWQTGIGKIDPDSAGFSLAPTGASSLRSIWLLSRGKVRSVFPSAQLPWMSHRSSTSFAHLNKLMTCFVMCLEIHGHCWIWLYHIGCLLPVVPSCL